MPTLKLQPINREIKAPKGTPLHDLLFEPGVEFPCGGHGRCRGCRVRVVEGELPINEAQRELLKPHELESGWRLACQSRLDGDLTLEMRQWEAAVLSDDTEFSFTPREGLGVAVDVGTTTLVAQLVDLQTGNVLAVKTALNPQARHGSDVMSRVEYAVAGGGAAELTDLIRTAVSRLIDQLFAAAGAERKELRDVTLVGNTVMHHLFGSIDLEPLSHYPFHSPASGLLVFEPKEIGWSVGARATVRFLPCLGGFVGSDILAGILATGIHRNSDLAALIDLGTNGEIVVGNRDAMLCAGTAAGPAFEGARISCGMRASTGAIWKVARSNGHLTTEVLGNVEARGVCGSGLVDAISASLDMGLVAASGRIASGRAVALSTNVAVTQTDIRQLQLAKGAVAAGLKVLLRMRGVQECDVSTVYLAGAFGNYIDRGGARRIGLLDFPLDRIQPAGNTALLGAKIALFSGESESGSFDDIRRRVTHVQLHADPGFQDAYVEAMSFPLAIS